MPRRIVILSRKRTCETVSQVRQRGKRTITVLFFGFQFSVSGGVEATNLEGDEEGDSLDAVVASVHIVAHEQIVGVGRLPPDPEQLHQVVELAVHVSAHCHRAFHLQRVAAVIFCPKTPYKD